MGQVDSGTREIGNKNGHFKYRTVKNELIARLVKKVFDLRPGMLIKNLKLRRPIYQQVAAYGHFGRNDLDLPWEKLNKTAALKKLAKTL